MLHAQDSIAAIATPRGQGGIGIIRISGPKSFSVLTQAVSAEGSGLLVPGNELRFQPRKMEHGWVVGKNGLVLDEVMAVFMPGPKSYTGEDSAEIHCHGGIAVLEAVLDAVLALGLRLAEPGEFTRRAFLNGRMDLSRAEAVAEMISAPTLEGVQLARTKLNGGLEKAVLAVRDELDWLRSRLCLYIDFPDESAEEQAADMARFMIRLQALQVRIAELVTLYERSKIWREGALAVLAGRTNVGKSSLLNAFLGRKRAIVSDTPGTTRDFIEESVNLEGLPVRLIDTAGLRSGGGDIEREGMELARDLFERADVILLVLDAAEAFCHSSRTPEPEIFSASRFTQVLPDEGLELLRRFGPQGKDRLMLVLNKIDVLPESEREACISQMTLVSGAPCLAVSAKCGWGVDALAHAMKGVLALQGNKPDFAHDAAPNKRQTLKLVQVGEELQRLADDYSKQIPAELLSVHLDGAAALLGEIIGLHSTEELLDEVFSSFCIGK